MTHQRIFVLVVLALGLLVPPVASAQDAGPPGNSAVDQYRESAPPATPGSKKLSEAQRKQLERRGNDGAALAAALDRNGGIPSNDSEPKGDDARATTSAAPGTGPSSSDDASGRSGSAGTEEPRAADSAGGDPGDGADDSVGPRSGGGSTTDAAVSSTVGPLPVWALLIGAVVVVGVGLAVRRRPSA